MAVRTDLTVDWEASPRIIEIASPSTTITIQDLHDSLTTLEMGVEGMGFKKLISSSGKEDLGGGIKVGVTATLQNAKLKFEARGGPSYISCTITNGNLVAVDANGDAINPIEPSAFTQITRENSVSATLVVNNPMKLGQYLAFK